MKMPGQAAARSQPEKSGAAVAMAVFYADRMPGESLMKVLHDDSAIAVVGITDDAPALLRLVDRTHPDVVLADAPPRELLIGLRRRHARTALIVLLENAEAEGGVDALAAGAQAILARASPVGDILTAIKAVASGYVVLPQGFLARLAGGRTIDDRSLEGNSAAGGHLTPRELQVLAAMANGASNKAIARRLGISFHTVKFHVAAVLAKLDADSRTEAVAKAAQLGLVML